jgi:hypothetical protein
MDRDDEYIFVKKSKQSKRGRRGRKVSPVLSPSPTPSLGSVSSPVSTSASTSVSTFNENEYHKSKIYKKLKEHWDYDLEEVSKLQKNIKFQSINNENKLNISMDTNIGMTMGNSNGNGNGINMHIVPPGLVRPLPVYIQPQPIRPPQLKLNSFNGGNTIERPYEQNFREYIPSPPLFVEKQYYENNPFIPTQRIIENESINFRC